MKKSKKAFAMNDDFAAEELAELLPRKEEEETISTEAAVKEQPRQQEEEAAAVRRDLSEQMDQVVRGLSGVQVGAQVYLVDVRQLEPYPDQPFRQYPLERLQELAEDIARVGVLSPILTRRHKSRLQILAGHNRWSAAKLAGLSQVPVMILEADDDQAALILTSTNLRQREKLLPSEKAFAYKMQMEALRRQGQRTEGGYSAASYITQQTGDSRMQIHRYIRLTELEPGLLELVDKGKISLTPAVSLSYLKAEDQGEVLRCVREMGAKVTIERGNALKRMAEEAGEECLGNSGVLGVLVATVVGQVEEKFVKIRWEKIRGYLPDGVEDVEGWIVSRLKRINEI